jgi:uroporphyrinogen III methyltransferase/synthase
MSFVNEPSSEGGLRGQRVLLTRPADSAAPWYAALTAAGARVVAYPTTTIAPPPSWAPLDAALGRLADYDWLVFTSATAVRFVDERWPRAVDVKTLARPQIAAVGKETQKALGTRGYPVARVPVDQRQEGLVAAFQDLAPGARVLFPRAAGGREFFIEALAARGISVDLVSAYETVALSPLPPLPDFDVAIFASPSALEAFVAGLGTEPLVGHPIVAIGPTTAAAAARLGLEVVLAASPQIDAVIAALAACASPAAPC